MGAANAWVRATRRQPQRRAYTPAHPLCMMTRAAVFGAMVAAAQARQTACTLAARSTAR